MALQSQRGLSRESQALLLKLMTEAIPGAKRLKGELPAGTVVAHKTGTGGTRNGIASATNDIGIIALPDGRHLAVAAFVSIPPPMMTRAMRSSPVWPKPPGIAPTR